MSWFTTRPIRSACLLSFAALVLLTSRATAQGVAGHVVHAVLVIDDNAPLAGIEKDLMNMQMALTAGLGPRDRVTFKVLQGREVTPANLGQTIRALPVGPDDVLLFYYTGHGATLEQTGHVMAFMGGRDASGEPVAQPVPRAEIRKLLLSKGARMTVLLSDCCANLVPIRREPPNVGAPAPGAPGPPPGPTTLQMLLFEHRGLVDLTSSMYDPVLGVGEKSWTESTSGSFFTVALTNLMMAPPDVLDVAPRDGFVEWKEFFPRVRSETNQIYHDFRSSRLGVGPDGKPAAGPELRESLEAQPDQTPQAFALPTRGGTGGGGGGGGGAELFASNLGISYRLVPYRDHLAASLTRQPVPNSPAASVGFEPGDQIYALDGVAIRSPEDVLGHVNQTVVEFVDVRTGQAKSTTLMLPANRPAPGPSPYVLGVTTIPTPVATTNGSARYGLHVMTVLPGGAAQRAGIEPGDILISANDRAIQSHGDLAQALTASNGRMRIVLINVRPPRNLTTIDVTLDPAGGGVGTAAPAAAAPTAPAPPPAP
ncbi:PDZ domain-containing protein [Paludisphaera rhizosphaerae]|uniref:PDZ domain-containing protein n=1 Tax=Paludisphaera rhizosphaerae TaxID=2711216 RepID=UPI0013EC9152|nr:PDZ domain-containing protein [Paludisphaera rhizosphaerae]